ncbi:hypothetical protein EJ06DRAFT_530640 [Trichodelitschia bisporula]|uniref:Integral membrane protein n=1 Tax=Trichodelitschia bisporula TaxID=703511 RepID=A0A6G1HVB0_9PEZI|nr:hypothetical protein EJ06DRAFT_530640 [Trichodelitschia bisporula]
MTSLIISPKKVFKSIYYHVRIGDDLWVCMLTGFGRNVCPLPSGPVSPPNNGVETKNTWHRPDPAFTYLLSFFLLLTSIAWGLAYANGFSKVFRITLVFIFGHFIGNSLLISTLAYFFVGRLLGPGVPGLPGRRRQGLFTQPGEGDQLEFGYCFDVSPCPWQVDISCLISRRCLSGRSSQYGCSYT